MSTTSTTDIIETMGQWFDKFPALPKKGREVLVTITPWIALVFGILGILGTISSFGFLAVLSPFAVFGGASGVASYGTGFISIIIYFVGYVLLLAAFPGTKAKKYKGWKLLFWSEAVFLIGGLIGFAIISAIIGALIGFYLLYQIKSYYK